MAFASAYASKRPDTDGFFVYSDAEHRVWRTLMTRQAEVLPHRAAPEVLQGLERLALPADRVPQVVEVDARLQTASGFGVVPVPAMISETEFFDLLASRRFPVATFVRRPEELDYLKEPDIFHEVYGHGPLLTDPDYAAAVEGFGAAARALGPAFFEPLHRLFWFTVEFGLVRTPDGLRVYGAGITSSPRETVYALEAEGPVRRPFDPVEVIATDYRIDTLQGRYFVLDQLSELYRLSERLVRDLPKWTAAAGTRREELRPAS